MGTFGSLLLILSEGKKKNNEWIFSLYTRLLFDFADTIWHNERELWQR